MSESPLLDNEEQYSWDVDPADEGREPKIRWRTLISADRTPSKGISFGVYEVPPGAEMAPHRHHPQEVYYITGGEAELFLDGVWRPLRRGDVVYIPGDAVHGTRNRGTSTCTIVWAFPTDTYEEIEYFEP
jgi:quercetin dioxygenase-like cupin family protein